MNALVKHIEALNVKTQEWVDAGPGRWAGMLTTDVKHWEDYGVYTPDQLDRYLDSQGLYECIASLTSKGYASSVVAELENASDEEWKKESEYWYAQSEQAVKQEAKKLQEDIKSWEQEVQDVISYGAGDRETALRWMTQDTKFWHTQDIEMWVYDKNILFSPVGRALVKELESIVTFEPWEEAA